MELNYHRTGSGEPLVLIHGTGSQWQIWGPVIEPVALHRDVIALDLPGFGDSPLVPGDELPTPSVLAREVIDFIDRLGLERPHLVGNSNGAWIALEMAKLGRARSVLGIAPMGLWKDSVPVHLNYPLVISRLLIKLLRPWEEFLLARRWVKIVFMSTLLGRPWDFPAEEAMRAVGNMADAPGFMPAVRGLRSAGHFNGGEGLEVPITLAFCSRDMGVRMRDAKQYAEVPPHTRWLTLRGCGHVPTFDDPALVAALLLNASEPGNLAHDGSIQPSPRV